jgi:signal transduction histidine kinase
VVALLFGSFRVSGSGGTHEFGCWVIPNAHVVRAPGTRACDVQTNGRVRKFATGDEQTHVLRYSDLAPQLESGRPFLPIEVKYGHEEYESALGMQHVSTVTQRSRLGAAALFGAILMALPFALAMREPDALAVPPITILYGAASFISVVGITSRASPWLTEAALLAIGITPAALLHLALTFPRVRPITFAFPETTRLPYASIVLLLPMGWFALNRTPIIWPSYLGLLVCLLFGAWLILGTSCYYAMKESESSVEIARSKVLLAAACVIPVPAAIALSPPAASVLELTMTALWASTVLLPIPIAMAISRYDLFSGTHRSRNLLETIAYLSAASIAITVLLQLALRLGFDDDVRPDLSLVFLLSFVCAVATEVTRVRMARLTELISEPGANKFQRLREEFQAELSSAGDSDQVLDRLARRVRDALGCGSGSILLVGPDGYAEAMPIGDGLSIGQSLANRAVEALRGMPVAHTELMEDELGAEAVEELQRAGVRVVADIMCSNVPVGLLLLGPRRDGLPYSGTDLEFIVRLCSAAAASLHRTRLVERSARQSGDPLLRIAEALSHDLGKEVDWMTRLVRRLPHATVDRNKLRRDIGLVLDITSNLADSLTAFLGQADSAEPEEIPAPVDAMIESAVQHATLVHGTGAVVSEVDPALSGVTLGNSLERVVANLVDNALQASPDGERVHLFAALQNSRVQIVVEDRGTGIDRELMPRLFERGFTTRREGGLGIGLSACRDIMTELGGAIEITTFPGGGTRATVLVPTG